MSEPDFEPEISWNEDVSAELAAMRADAERESAVSLLLLREHVDLNVRVCGDVVDALELAHRAVGDLVDFDLTAQTRWVAIWELSGRCIGLARLLVTELGLGFTAEAGGTMRALHEAANLVSVATHETDGALTQQWLRGRTIKQKAATRVRRAEYTRIVRDARDQGMELDVHPDIGTLTGPIYGVLSAAAHSTRPGFRELVSHEPRVFVYGPHPSFQVRAEWVDYANVLVEQVVLDVGGALMAFYGRGWFPRVIMPLVDGLARVRRD